MPNLLKYNTSPESQSLRKGYFYVGVGDTAKDTTWYTGWDAPPGGYVVYSNKASGGPAIEVLVTEAALISYTNRISGSSFTTATGCFVWFASQNDRAVFDRQFSPVVTDGLLFYTDFKQIPAYPRTSTVIYDLRGQVTGCSGVVQNGATYSSVGFFSTDGSNDRLDFTGASNGPQYLNGSSVTGGTPFTVSALFKFNAYPLSTGGFNYSSVIMKNSYNPSWGMSIEWSGAAGAGIAHTSARLYNGGRSGTTVEQFSTGLPLGRWIKADFTMSLSSTTYTLTTFINGAINAGPSNTTNAVFPLAIGNNGTLQIMGSSPLGGNGAAWAGSGAQFMVYNRVLSAAEVARNYYGGPIVTTGLSAVFDAGNLVSYPAEGTTAYSLTGSNTATMVNGLGYTSVNEGAWVFDGSNDSLDLIGDGVPLDSASAWTVTAWAKPATGYNVSAINAGGILGNTSGGPVVHNFSVQSGKIGYVYYGPTGGAGSNAAWKTYVGSINVNNGQWYHLAWVNSANVVNLYVNGVPAGSTGSTVSSGVRRVNRIGRAWDSSTSFNGSIAYVSIQGTALSQAQVLQNFNAHRWRFLT